MPSIAVTVAVPGYGFGFIGPSVVSSVLVVNVAMGVTASAAVKKRTVFPLFPADHQNPTYFTPAGRSSCTDCEHGVVPQSGAERYFVPAVLTVGVSVAVFAPPHTLVAPSTILHGCVWPVVLPIKEKVPTTEVALIADILHVPAA